MGIFSKFREALRSVFADRAAVEIFETPDVFNMPLRWPDYITQHIKTNSNQTMDTQICAAKWKAALNIMQGATGTSAKNAAQEAFLNHLNVIRASIEISNKELFPVPTKNLIEVYRNRSLFDEIENALAQRPVDLRNIFMFPGVNFPSGNAEAQIVSAFKDKYIEMMEQAVLPSIIPGWNKAQPQPAQLVPEAV